MKHLRDILEFKLDGAGNPIYPPDHEPGTKEHFMHIGRQIVHHNNEHERISSNNTGNKADTDQMRHHNHEAAKHMDEIHKHFTNKDALARRSRNDIEDDVHGATDDESLEDCWDRWFHDHPLEKHT